MLQIKSGVLDGGPLSCTSSSGWGWVIGELLSDTVFGVGDSSPRLGLDLYHSCFLVPSPGALQPNPYLLPTLISNSDEHNVLYVGDSCVWREFVDL